MWTDRSVQAAKPRKYRYRLSKPIGIRIPGSLALEVQPGGAKIFFYMYYRLGKRILIKIGKYKKSPSSPGWTLSAAGEKAREYADQLLKGNDPKIYAEGQDISQLRATTSNFGTLLQLLNSYLAAMEADGRRSAQSVRNSLECYVINPFPDLVKLPASEITPEDISQILARMINIGIKAHTNRVRSYLHAAFSHGIKQQNNPRYYTEDRVKFGIRHNPVSQVPRQADYEKTGEHVISEEEIRTIWKDDAMPDLPEILIKLALVTGQRVGELSRTEWKNIDFVEKTLLIPETVSKNGRDHLVPLTDLSIPLLTEAHNITGNYQLVFTGSYKGKLKDGVYIHNSTIAKAIRSQCKRIKIRKYIAKDIRRTWKTLAGKAGLTKEIRDRIQNHAISDVSTKHYDRHDYLPEKLAGMRIWNDYLKLIINPINKVTHIKERQG